MSAKDNFAQAFKELISGAAPAENSSKVAKDDITDQAAVTPISEPIAAVTAPTPVVEPPAAAPIAPSPVAVEPTPIQTEPEMVKPPVQEKRGFSPFSGFGGFGSQNNNAAQNNAPTPPVTTPPNTPPTFANPFADFTPPVAGTTTIASGTVVIGEIHSKGDINLYGEVKGNVETLGNVQLGGKVMGNIAGNDMVLQSSAIKGNVAADGSITLDEASVVMGDLKAKDGEFDGKIKGNLQVEGLARFQGNTVLLGNVNVGSLIIEQGARLRGEICTGNRESFDIQDPFQG